MIVLYLEGVQFAGMIFFFKLQIAAMPMVFLCPQFKIKQLIHATLMCQTIKQYLCEFTVMWVA